MSRFQAWRAFAAQKLRRVTELVFSQGIAIVGNLLYGFLCIRLLPVPDYAKYSVVFSVLSALTLLMDIGFSGALLPLIGERIDDLDLIADYVASLRTLAHRLFFLVAPVTIVVFPLFVRRQDWNWPTITAMLAILLVGAWCARVVGAYGAVLIVRRDRKSWYRAQLVSSLGGLAILGILWAIHCLNGFSAILVNVAGNIYISLHYFYRARHLLKTVGRASKEKCREIIHLALPSMPMVIFYSLQGQVALLLITLFGHTSQVASVGALTRLAQIFALSAPINLLLIEPYFAKLPKSKLKLSYLGATAILIGIGGSVVLLATVSPELFLWVLGPKYTGLHSELLLVMITAALNYIGTAVYVINAARKFVYWWSTWIRIVLTLLVQVIFIWKIDLSSMSGVLMFSVANAAAALVVCILTSIYGFCRGPRELIERDSLSSSSERVIV